VPFTPLGFARVIAATKALMLSASAS